MKERTKRLCDSIIALSLAVSVLSSAAAIKTYSARLDVARPGVTAFADGEEPTEPAGDMPTNEEPASSVVVFAKVNGKVTLYPDDGFSVTETDGSFTVNVADLNVPDDTESGKAGEVFKGWALKDGGVVVTEVGKNDFNPVDDKLVVTLYPVWGAPEPTRDGAKGGDGGEGGEGGEGEGGEAQGLTDEQKANLNAAAAVFNKAYTDAQKIRTDAGKADADKEDLQNRYNTVAATVTDKEGVFEGIDESLQDDACYKTAKSAYDKANDMLSSTQYTIDQLLSAEEKATIESIKQYLADAKTLADEAKAAADDKDADTYNTKRTAAQQKERDAIDLLNTIPEANGHQAAAEEATQSAYNAYAKAVSAAVASYNRNIAIAKDAQGKAYTGSQIYADVTEIDQTEKGKAAAAYMKTQNTAYTNDDKHYLRVFDVALKTVSGDKPVTLNAGQSCYVSELGGSDLDKRVKTCEVFYVDDTNSGATKLDEIDWYEEINKGGYYTFYVSFDTHTPGTFAVTGSYYAKSNAVVENDTGEEFEQKDVTKDNNDNTNKIISVSIVTDDALKKKEAIQSLSDAERARVIAVYKIHLVNAHVVDGQQVEVSVTDSALKNKKISKIDLVHITTPKNETKSGISVGSNGNFKFKTGSFSYFVALSSTSSDSSSSGDSSSTGTTTDSPRTGEGSPLPFVLAAVGALAVAGGVIVWRKKKTAQD